MTLNLSDAQSTYIQALRNGDEVAARALVSRLRSTGVEPNTIYFQIFAPSMMTIGELWERNELSVAEEHLATAITERLISELSPWFSEMAASGQRGCVVLGCIEGERHVLGLRMLADLFRWYGWRVIYLGADVPSADWAPLVVRYTPDAVAISASHPRRVASVGTLIATLREVQPALQILVGGAAFDQEPDRYRRVGAHLYNPDPVAAVAELTAFHRDTTLRI